MILILLFWGLLFLTTCGVGAASIRGLRAVSRHPNDGRLDLFQCFWVGCLTTIVGAQVWHFLLPLNIIALMLWLAAGMLNVRSLFRNVLRQPRPGQAAPLLRPSIGIPAFIVCLALLLYLGAAGVAGVDWSHAYDSDLYHFQSLRWMNEYPAVPGLGNLHSRLAHTSGFLVFSALIDNGLWDRSTAWLMYGLLVSVAVAQWLWTVLNPWADESGAVRVYSLLTLPWLLQLQTAIHPTLYFDNIALIVQFVLMLELLRGYGRPVGHGGTAGDAAGAPDHTRLMILSGLAALGFSIKPLGALTLLMVGGFSAVTILRASRRAENGWEPLRAGAMWAGVLPAVLLLSHVVRNAILAGWLLYPAPIGRLNVDWAMPAQPLGASHEQEMQSVEGQYEVIKAWARLPGAHYHKALSEGFAFWFPHWKRRVWHGLEPRWFFAGLVMLAGYLVHALFARRRPGEPRAAYGLFLVALAAGNIGFWFVSAPDMRFGSGFFWIWLGVTGGLLFSRVLKPRAACGLALLFCGTALLVLPVDFVPTARPLFAMPGEAAARPTQPVVVDSSREPPLVVHVPIAGDRSGDSPLPSTPYPLQTLRWRDPGSLRAGFASGEPRHGGNR